MGQAPDRSSERRVRPRHRPRPLRWGRRGERELVGGTAIVAGALLIVQMNSLSVWAGFVGAAIHVTGWILLPGGGVRRGIAAPLSFVAVSTILLGPQLAWTACIPLAFWLLVRRSPGATYLLVPIPALWSIALLGALGMGVNRLLLFGSTLAVSCAMAMWAGAIARREIRPASADFPADS